MPTIYMRNKNVVLMPDRSGPASGTVVQQGAAGKYATVGQMRKRGGSMSGTSIREGWEGRWR